MEFVHSDAQTLLRKTNINSLVKKHFYLLDKAEFKFPERVGTQRSVLGFFSERQLRIKTRMRS